MVYANAAYFDSWRDHITFGNRICPACRLTSKALLGAGTHHNHIATNDQPQTKKCKAAPCVGLKHG